MKYETSIMQFSARTMCICRVDQCRLYTLYMTVFLMISLPEIAYIHRIYIYIWFWPTLYIWRVSVQNFLQEFYQIYRHIRRICPVMANPWCACKRHVNLNVEVAHPGGLRASIKKFLPTIFVTSCDSELIWC
jgi:hypothetical protein